MILKQHDIPDDLVSTLESPPGSAADLTGAIVTFYMRFVETRAIKVTAACVVSLTQLGVVRHTWLEGDLDTEGEYEAEYEVLFAGGRKRTFPEAGYIPIKVKNDVNGA